MFIALTALCFAAQIFALRHYIKIMYPTLGWNTLLSKLLCSGIFVLTAVFAAMQSGNSTDFAKFMLAGFICSFLGDLFLHTFPKFGVIYVNYGLGGASFLAGHVLFALAFFKAGFAIAPGSPAITVWEGVAVVALAVGMNLLMRLLGLKLGKASVPIFIYSLALSLTVVKASSVGIKAIGAAGTWPVLVTLGLGAVLFAASDLVLASDFFTGGKNIKKKTANMVLYYSGQMLLALSLMWVNF